MAFLIRIILVSVIIYFIFKFIIRIASLVFGSPGSGRSSATNQSNSNFNHKVGETVLDKKPDFRGDKNKQGEYVDFEEVKGK